MTPYRQELEKYRDIDEDKILQELSPEELAQLDAELAEMDPENVLLPAGLRQRDQTQKSPTGPLDRDALLQHLERQALEAEERQDLVPFTAILGMYTLMSNKQYYDAICSGNISNTEGINMTLVSPAVPRTSLSLWPLSDPAVPNCPQDIPVPTLEAICQAIKTNTHVRSLSLVATRSNDLVANVSPQMSPSVPTRGGGIPCSVSLMSPNIPGHFGDCPDRLGTVPAPCPPCPQRSLDRLGTAVAEMLEQNQSLQSLNLESNFISSAGMLRLLEAMGHNQSLSELRVDNQVTMGTAGTAGTPEESQRLGDTVEMAMAATLERCPSLLRLGFTFTLQGPRARAAAALTRNNELRQCPQGPPMSPRVTKCHQGSPNVTKCHQGSPNVTK
ncbi:Tropomodulin-4, partial [Lamprotornis superbus]